jgi:glutaminase
MTRFALAVIRDAGAQSRGPSLPSLADPLTHYLAKLRAELMPVVEGEVATYIPELAKADPDHLAIAIATTDGRVYSVGEADVGFTIQSVSKPFAYAHALANHGRETVLAKVGVEPTGDPFNSITLDDVENRPFNPMVNAGAIAVAELYSGATLEERVETMITALSRFAGRRLAVDEAVFASESLTGHRNRAIAYLMRNSDMIRRAPEEVLDVYFRQCSVLVTCRDLAVMAATLANDGANPITEDEALPQEFVKDVLTVMHSCGMYDFAGQWSYEVGIAAKSGVSGCIIAVVPGQIGIAAYSPRLDKHGNSVRGILACRRISEDFGLHPFRSRSGVASVLRRELDGRETRSKRMRSSSERMILSERGSSIRVIEAQGPLFFGTAERLVHRALELRASASHVILDFRHVHRVDRSAFKLLRALAALATSEHGKIYFSSLPSIGPLAKLHSTLVTEGTPNNRPIFFDNLDDALEHAENDLLAEAAAHDRGHDELLTLSQMAVFQNLDPEELKLLTGSIDPALVHFAKGEIIFREGEPATKFYTIARGSVRVELPIPGPKPHAIRLASIGKGLTFGELAGLDGKPRPAQVVAEQNVACYAVEVEALHAFGKAYPSIYAKILLNIIRDLADTLRIANDALRASES